MRALHPEKSLWQSLVLLVKWDYSPAGIFPSQEARQWRGCACTISPSGPITSDFWHHTWGNSVPPAFKQLIPWLWSRHWFFTCVTLIDLPWYRQWGSDQMIPGSCALHYWEWCRPGIWRFMAQHGFFLALIISSNVIKIQILKLCFFFHSSPFSRMLHTCVYGGYTYIHTAHIHSQKTQTCICWITYGNEYTRACLCVYIPYIFCMWSWDTVNETQSSIHELEERWALMDIPIEAWLISCRIMDLNNSEIVRSRNMGMCMISESDTSLLLFLLADII